MTHGCFCEYHVTFARHLITEPTGLEMPRAAFHVIPQTRKSSAAAVYKEAPFKNSLGETNKTTRELCDLAHR